MRIARIFCILFLAAFGSLAIPVQSSAQVAVGISVRIGPPVLPVYAQPICPGPGYLWVPGYWAYDDDDGYYWVPGTWALPPEEGLLWTPGYWGWGDGFYIWHTGYWGPVVGFYGGINYGFGYPGVGFYGGYWREHEFFYNRSITNVNVTVVHNTYNTTVINNNRNVTRVSFNGGPGGINARPTSTELAAEHQRHVSMTAEQSQHLQAARSDRSLRASVNHGRPDVAATPRPAELHGRGAMQNGRTVSPNRPPDNRSESGRSGRPPENNQRTLSDRPPTAQPRNDSPVNPKLEQKHQQQLDRMRQQQDAERQKMQRQHDQEQSKLNRRNTDQPRQDQLQRRQQQQAEQMNRKHDEQMQKLQQHQQHETERQQPKPAKPSKPNRPE